MATRTMNEFYVSELQRLYGQEQQVERLLPELAEASRSPELQKMFRDYRKELDNQVKRLEQVFRDVGHKPLPKRCPRVEGLCRECRTVAALEGDEHVRDVALIATAQHLMHDGIASYGCARTWADLLGKTAESKLLAATLDEKKHLDTELSKLAKKVNKEATALTA